GDGDGDGDVPMRERPAVQNAPVAVMEMQEMEIEGDFGGGGEELEVDIPSPAATLLDHPVMGKLLFERHPHASDNSIPEAAPPPSTRPVPGASKSYAPYATRSNFMIANYAIKNNLSFAATNALYNVLLDAEFRLEELQYKNSDHIRSALGNVELLGGKVSYFGLS
ncbi:hypothetical protein P7C70_g8820, partial [Phenoliferia sp. Uapishka_3]